MSGGEIVHVEDLEGGRRADVPEDRRGILQSRAQLGWASTMIRISVMSSIA